MQVARVLLALSLVLAAAPIARGVGPDDAGCVNVAYSASGDGFWLYPSLGDAIGLMVTEGVGSGASVGFVVIPSLCASVPFAPPTTPASSIFQGAFGQRMGSEAPALPPVLPLP